MAGVRNSLKYLLIFYIIEEYIIVANFFGSQKSTFLVKTIKFLVFCDQCELNIFRASLSEKG